MIHLTSHDLVGFASIFPNTTDRSVWVEPLEAKAFPDKASFRMNSLRGSFDITFCNRVFLHLRFLKHFALFGFRPQCIFRHRS